MIDGEAIRAARERLGWSQSKLAGEASRLGGASIPQQAVTRIEAGGESKHKLAILRALDLLDRPSRQTEAAVSSDVETVGEAPPFRRLGGPRDVPELGIAVGGEDGDFTLNGTTLDYLPRPAALATRDVFAVRVKNDSMSPRFDEGHLLYVDRHREPRPGEDGIIELWPEEDGAAGRAFVKQIVSKSAVRVVARQFNPVRELTFERDRVKAIYRIVPNNELFGV